MHQLSIVRIRPSNFGGEVNKTSMTYLNASGNARGRVNLPTPIKAAPATKRKYGRRHPANLKITDLEKFSSCAFIQFLNKFQGGTCARAGRKRGLDGESNLHARRRP